MTEFYHIYNFDAVEHRDELLRFWGQRSRSQQGEIDTLGDIFLSVSGVQGCNRSAWMYFKETYHIYSLPGLHDTDDSLQVKDSEVTICVSFLLINGNNFTSISGYTVGRGIWTAGGIFVLCKLVSG